MAPGVKGGEGRKSSITGVTYPGVKGDRKSRNGLDGPGHRKPGGGRMADHGGGRLGKV